MYKAHVSRSKQQSTKESFNNFRDRYQLSKELFHLKDSLESCAARNKEVIKSSSPINRRLQQEGNVTFEQKKKEHIHQEPLCLQIAQELYLCFEQAALFVY